MLSRATFLTVVSLIVNAFLMSASGANKIVGVSDKVGMELLGKLGRLVCNDHIKPLMPCVTSSSGFVMAH